MPSIRPAAGEFGGIVERLQDVAAGGRAHPARCVLVWGEGWTGQEQRACGRGRQVLRRIVARQVERETGALRTPLQEPGVADDDNVYAVGAGCSFSFRMTFRQDAGDDFRPDATGVAQ